MGAMQWVNKVFDKTEQVKHPSVTCLILCRTRNRCVNLEHMYLGKANCTIIRVAIRKWPEERYYVTCLVSTHFSS